MRMERSCIVSYLDIPRVSQNTADAVYPCAYPTLNTLFAVCYQHEDKNKNSRHPSGRGP